MSAPRLFGWFFFPTVQRRATGAYDGVRVIGLWEKGAIWNRELRPRRVTGSIDDRNVWECSAKPGPDFPTIEAPAQLNICEHDIYGFGGCQER
jgi:hypothetical protein